MIKTLTLATAAVALTTAPVLAGSPEPAPIEPIIETPAPAPVGVDWTGFYVGGELGSANFDVSPGADTDEFIGGLVAGYDWDMGTWVVGVGADFDFADDVDLLARAKARAGYKIGQGLVYGTAGYTSLDIEDFGDDDGWVAGVGYEHMVSNNFSLGGEVLYHEYDNFKSTGLDVDVTSVQLRGTFRF